MRMAARVTQPFWLLQRGRRAASVCASHALLRGSKASSIVSKAPPHELFPFAEPFHVNDRKLSASEVLETLRGAISDERVDTMLRVCSQRTFDIVPVVEGLYDLGNIAAVSRSCDALGYGQLHIVETPNATYKQSARISKGTEKWLDVRRWTDMRECMQRMREQGRQVLVTHCNANAIPIADVDWTQPSAVIFGNELEGCTAETIAAADHAVVIPMSGFAQSFNISVAASLTLYEAQQQRLRKLGYHASLDPTQQRILAALMVVRHQRHGPAFLTQLLQQAAPSWQASRIAVDEKRKARMAAMSQLRERLHARQAVARAQP